MHLGKEQSVGVIEEPASAPLNRERQQPERAGDLPPLDQPAEVVCQSRNRASEDILLPSG